jgi:hypothetical protein
VAVDNIRRSGSSYLLTTHYPALPINSDIAMGQWRPINFLLSPFCWPTPEAELFEECDEVDRPDRTLSVWAVKDLGQA